MMNSILTYLLNLLIHPKTPFIISLILMLFLKYTTYIFISYIVNFNFKILSSKSHKQFMCVLLGLILIFLFLILYKYNLEYLVTFTIKHCLTGFNLFQIFCILILSLVLHVKLQWTLGLKLSILLYLTLIVLECLCILHYVLTL